MTMVELYTQLRTLNLPLAYSHFPSDDPNNPPPTPPFVVYLQTYNSDIMADNQNYVAVVNYQVELYSRTKDVTNEAAIENLFKANGITYGKTETWLPSEKLRQVVYEIQLIGG